MVLHELDERVDRLAPEVLLAAAGRARRPRRSAASRRAPTRARRASAPPSGRRSRRRGRLRSVSTRWPFDTTPSVRRIWLSRRATVVLPVPGLPVNTRWWLVSIVGRPRSARSCWMRSRLVRRRTSALTSVEADEGVELGEQLLDRSLRAAARARAAVGRCGAGRSPAAADRHRRRALAGPGDAGGVERPQQHVAEVVDGGDLVGRRHEVDRRRGVGEAHARRRSSAPARAVPSRASARTSRSNSVLGSVEPRAVRPRSSSLSRSCGGRHPHRRLEPCADVVEPRLELGRSSGARRCR